MALTATTSSAGSASISGLISGLDTDGIITKMMDYAKKPVAILQDQQAGYMEKLTAWQNANTRLLALKTNAASIATAVSFQTKTVSVSDDSALGVTVSSTTTPGSYTFTVNRLAAAEQRQSQSFADMDKTTIGTGSVTVGSGENTQTITINGSNNTLAGLRDSINKANTGVTASIVDLGSQGAHDYRLSLASNSTGQQNAITWTPTLTGGTAPAWTVTAAAQDASITVGTGATATTVTQSSNTISSIYPGMVLTLKEADTGTAIKVDVSADTDALKGAITSFVNQYNSLMDFMNDQQKFDSTTNTSGTLFGDFALQNVESTLRSGVLNSVVGLPSAMSSLSQIGFTSDSNDHLVVDSATLASAMSSNPNGVMKLFAGYGEASDQTISFLASGTKTQASGTAGYKVRIDQVAAAARVTAGAAQTDVLASSETITINSNTIALQAGWTQQQVVDAINAKSTVTGITASATSADGSGSGNYLTLTANSVGASSHVTVLDSVSNGGVSTPTTGTAGFGSAIVTEALAYGENGKGSGTVGKDVAGAFGVTVNGVTTWEAATGQGQTLSGASGNKNTDGLQVISKATTTGDHGTVTLTLGVAAQLNNSLDYLTGTNGAVTTAQTSLSAQIDDIKSTIASQQDRLTIYEDRIRTQFQSMETQMGELQSQSTYLSSQISSWSKSSSS
ncbi:MAG TPA: flagellar filament capping protein FliD [Armatimonadota bacterium]|jgi:flagellar hook-associated protein 2